MAKGKKKQKRLKQTRADPTLRDTTSSSSLLCSLEGYDMLCASGYTNLSSNPEVRAAVGKICDLISSMTIHLKQNTGNGDQRVINGLSRKIDINPNQWMTRKTFIYAICKSLLLEGDGNAVVVPTTKDGYIDNLIPIPPAHVGFLPDYPGYGYKIMINGIPRDPNDVMHFMINPNIEYPWKGTGYRVVLKDVADNLKQAAATTKGFLESKWKPSIIVKVDSTTSELSDPAGRKKILESYIQSNEAGEPWVIPAEEFDMEVVRPLSLTDLAISDAVKLDKRTVAAILDVPAFVVGEGAFNENEWNNFIDTRIKFIAQAIEQEMTRKLLYDPTLYFKFNYRSLYSYNMKTMADVGGALSDRGILTPNEVRDWIGMSPGEGMDEFRILENYIPTDMIGNQQKLMGGGSDA